MANDSLHEVLLLNSVLCRHHYVLELNLVLELVVKLDFSA